MNLLNKTTTQTHILQLEKFADTENRAIAAAISVLNNSYHYLWSLPDNELVDVLQELLNTGKLQSLFENHYVTAINLNAIQDNTEYSGPRAIAVAGREFEVSPEGIVSLVYPPEPEIIEEPPIEPSGE